MNKTKTLWEEALLAFDYFLKFKFGNHGSLKKTHAFSANNFKEFVKDRNLEDISKIDVEAYLLDLKNQNISNDLKSTRKSGIKLFLQFLHEQEYLPANLFVPIKLENKRRKFNNLVTEEQVNLILSNLVDESKKIFFLLLSYSSLPVSRLIFLKKKDIDFENKKVGKSGYLIEKIRIPLYQHTAKLEDDDWLFPSPQDISQPISDRALTKELFKLTKELNLLTNKAKSITSENLRQFAINNLIHEEKVYVIELSRQLGYKNIFWLEFYN